MSHHNMQPIHLEMFNRHRPDFDKLLAYGFVPQNIGQQDEQGTEQQNQNQKKKAFYFTQNICDDAFQVQVTVFADGQSSSLVMDLLDEEEYINVRIPSVQGGFVNSVREAYQAVLADIVASCFIPTRFANEQTNRLADWLLSEFGDEPDAPFAKYQETGVFRNPDTQKWYALITQVTKRTFEPNLSDIEGKQKIEIINIKVDSDTISNLHQENGIYPAYHMNKKHWVSIVLDDSLSDERLFQLLSKSRDFTVKKARKPRTKQPKPPQATRTEIKHWVIPANPTYYDVIKVFSEKDVIYWYQGANFIKGDIVYMYLGKPYSAILYKCEVIEVDIPADNFEKKVDKNGKPIKRMNLKRLNTYAKNEFPLSKLKALGLTSIRGARGVPDAVVQAIQGLERL